MKDTLKKLWHDYLLDECGKIKTDDERELLSKLADLSHEIEIALGDKSRLLDEYTSHLWDANSYLVTRAFCQGISFTANFLFEALLND